MLAMILFKLNKFMLDNVKKVYLEKIHKFNGIFLSKNSISFQLVLRIERIQKF